MLTQLGNTAEREWYAAQTVQHGWSSSTLALSDHASLSRSTATKELLPSRREGPLSPLTDPTVRDYRSGFLRLNSLPRSKAARFWEAGADSVAEA